MSEPKKLAIEIGRFEIPLDPPVHVFNVIVSRGGGSWHETYGSEELLQAFLQGVRAGYDGYISLPEVPSEAKPFPPSPHEMDG